VTGEAGGPHPATAVELKAQIEAERTGQPFVAYRDAQGDRHLLTIEAGVTELWVGRSPSADVQLAWDEEVSALHAQLEVVRDELTLVDDGLSRNGSFVNGERVRGRRRLADGDLVLLGHTMLVYAAAAIPDSVPTDAARDGAPPALSPAQRRVLAALCRPALDHGFAGPPSNREIAAELFVSVDTVKSHLHALFDLFGVEDMPQNRKRAELVRRAFECGLVG
jgi:FHA domain-containing protein